MAVLPGVSFIYYRDGGKYMEKRRLWKPVPHYVHVPYMVVECRGKGFLMSAGQRYSTIFGNG